MNGPGLSIVLAGGGCRTFWSLGVLRALGRELPPVAEWAGVSAGAAMAVICASGRGEQTMDYFLEATARNRRNFYPGRLFGSEPAFPHEEMYRAALGHALAGEGFAQLRRARPVRILLAYIGAKSPALRTALGAMRAYARRKRQGILHGPDEPHPGLCAQVVTAQQAEAAQAVVNQVLYSSATPPVTRVPKVDGRTYIDGGMIDNVPVRALSQEARAGRALVLLTRPLPAQALPNGGRRLYLAPGRPVAIKKWDYASPEKLRATFEQGREEAKRLMPAIEDFLEAAAPEA